MKVVFDLGTPKQVRFFLPLAARLQAKGCATSFVTRDCTEVNILVDALGIATLRLGRHGGPMLLGKLRSAAERIDLVAEYLNRTAPDVLVALGSPDSVRAAFGLDIPVVSFCDLPEATAVARLRVSVLSRKFDEDGQTTFPLSNRLSPSPSPGGRGNPFAPSPIGRGYPFAPSPYGRGLG